MLARYLFPFGNSPNKYGVMKWQIQTKVSRARAAGTTNRTSRAVKAVKAVNRAVRAASSRAVAGAIQASSSRSPVVAASKAGRTKSANARDCSEGAYLARMTTYFFHLATPGQLIVDDQGIELSSLQQVRKVAVEFARDIISLLEGRELGGYAFTVTDERGQHVMVFEFKDLLRGR